MSRNSTLTWSDRLLFGATNAWFYLTRPLLVLRYHRKLGQWPNLATPGRLTELVQWRKLFDRNPDFVVFADKLATKAWVAERLPTLAMAETLWVGERPEDIPAEFLTPGYVVKTNNASGQNYLPHRGELPRADVDRQFRRWLRASAAKQWLGWLDNGQEWAYRLVPSRIFVERQVGRGGPLLDIAVRVLDGGSLLVICELDVKTEKNTWGYFWPDGTLIDDPKANTLPAGFALPDTFSEAVRSAAKLGQGFDYLRIDFLTDGETLYAGEITCYPASGFSADDPFIGRLYVRWLETLPLSWALSTPQPWPRRVYFAALRRWLDRRQREVAAMPLPKGRGASRSDVSRPEQA